VASLFQQLSNEVKSAGVKRRSTEARDWFIKRLKSVTNINRESLLKDSELKEKSRPLPGRMFMFFYDPKTKETLPYYDRFPLTIMVGPAPGGFFGLNLHYLEPRLRAVFLDKLMSYTNSKTLSDTSKLAITYDMLRGVANLKEFSPCFKRYLSDHVRSSMVMVPAPEWEIAIFLPTEKFAKKSSSSVWAESKASI